MLVQISKNSDWTFPVVRYFPLFLFLTYIAHLKALS